MLSSLSTPPSPSHADDADYVLGQTGDTVIYIFPSGDALMNRDAAEAPAALVDHQQRKASYVPVPPTSDAHSPDDAALIDRLLAEGRLTVAQVQVARYDQEVTGMSLAESLTLRGWI
ncbi:MAG: hypothetical protein ACHWZW_23460 [Spirulina sp.]